MPAPLLRIKSQAPTRIDLAGGTLDIWPLYLFIPNATTINLAIDLYATTLLDENTDGLVILESGDQKESLQLRWDEIDQALKTVKPSLELHLKYLNYFLRLKKSLGKFDPSRGLKLTTSALSPSGAGLGGSSTLSVSIIGALKVWMDGKINPLKQGESLVEITRDVESTVIKVPAGLQDYYGAMFGGLQSLKWGAGFHERRHFSAHLLSELSHRLVLFYSGQSRNSGINNWALFKSYIDQNTKVQNQFSLINEAALTLEQAIDHENYHWIGESIENEWATRRTLAEGITTSEIDLAFEKAQTLGIKAGKICGAGGGGCFFMYLPQSSPALRTQLIEQVCAIPSVRHLPFKASSTGLNVQLLHESH